MFKASKKFVNKYVPGYQTISAAILTAPMAPAACCHIVINGIRITDIDRKPYMDVLPIIWQDTNTAVLRS